MSLAFPCCEDSTESVVSQVYNHLNLGSPPRILVSSAQPLPRQRFSIGHELAHLLLHEEVLIVHAHYYKRQLDQKEIDADAFSAELIMPRDLLTKSIES